MVLLMQGRRESEVTKHIRRTLISVYQDSRTYVVIMRPPDEVLDGGTLATPLSRGDDSP